MKKRNKALLVWATVTLLSLLLCVTVGTRSFTDGALLIIWAFFSWNFFAYGFDFDMWPWVFVELEGRGKGKPSHREFYFWFTAAIYVALLATIAWAE